MNKKLNYLLILGIFLLIFGILKITLDKDYFGDNQKSTATLFQSPQGFEGPSDGSINVEISTNNLKNILPETFGFQLANYYEMIFYNKKNPAQYNSTTNIYTEDLIQDSWVKSIKAKVFRFPGGVAGNNFHIWKSKTDKSLSKGNGYRQEDFDFYLQNFGMTNFAIGYYGNTAQSYLSYQETLPTNFVTPFINLAKSTKAKVVTVANIQNSSPEEVVDYIKYLKINNIGVVAVALGSETYDTERFLFDYNAEAYINQSEPIAKAIKDYDKNIKITLVAAPIKNPGNAQYNLFNTWNQRINTELKNKMYKNARLYDGVDFHRYQQLNCLDNYTTPSEIFDCGIKSMNIYMNYPTRQIAKTSTGFDVRTQTFQEFLDYLRTYFPEEPIYITEWGIAGWTNIGQITGVSPYSGTILSGAFAMNFINYINKYNSENNYPIKNTTYQNIAGYRTYCMICERDVTRGETFQDTQGTIYNRTVPYFAHKFLGEAVYARALKLANTVTTFPSLGLPQIPLEVSTYTTPGSNSQIFLYFTNLSGKNLAINSILKDDKKVDLNRITEAYYVYGDEPYATRGIGYWQGNQPNGVQAQVVEKEIIKLNKFIIPKYSFGYLKFDPIIIP